MSPVDVPDAVRNKARAAGATGWLDGLGDLIAGLARDWSITVGAPLTGGTEAFVAEAVMGDGTPAVLKLCVPRDLDAARLEITVLRLADGDGCARLYRDDVDRGALLLERLGPSMFDLGLPYEQRRPLLVASAQAMWRPVADDLGLTSGDAKGRWLADHVLRQWNALDRPCSERAVEHAIAAVERRVAAHDDERAVLVHGDIHQWNALRAAGGGFKLVDPDGMRAEPEYDLGILMREDPTEGDLRERARWLAALTGLDERAIWEWGAIERVSTGLLCTEIDLQPAGAEMLAAADRAATT